MATVYSTSILGGYNEVPNLMMSTKATMAMVLHLCSINARARLDFLENVSQSEFMKKAQDNMLGAGDSAMSCFDFPFNEAPLIVAKMILFFQILLRKFNICPDLEISIMKRILYS